MKKTISAHEKMQIVAIKADETLHPLYREAAIARIQGSTCLMPAKDQAKEIRKRLKAAFPGVKFSVRSATYKECIEWTDGPSKDAVKELLGAMIITRGFDSMRDYAYHHHHLVLPDGTVVFTPDEDEDGAAPEEARTINLLGDFNLTRHITDDIQHQALASVIARYGAPNGDNGLGGRRLRDAYGNLVTIGHWQNKFWEAEVERLLGNEIPQELGEDLDLAA
jgi:hypothetical protein